MKQLTVAIAVSVCVYVSVVAPVQAAPKQTVEVKELNFVFLHGMGGGACSLQLLADSILELAPTYILDYEQRFPGTKVVVNTLNRCYPPDEDISTWADNLAETINKHFDKQNLILIGHSMGGKAALHALAHNTADLAEHVPLVVTINSPIKRLDKYYVTGGGSVVDYCRARWLFSDVGVCSSVAGYDSSSDGSWVGKNKHWLAFISGEGAPSSQQFDIGGLDAWPRNMDDGIVPISAQYSDGADVVYYGEYGHSDVALIDEVARFIADQILHYLFGWNIECSVFARGGSLEHKADLLPGADRWEEVVGDVIASSGSLQYDNKSYIRWQAWEDTIGECSQQDERSRYQVSLTRSFLYFIRIVESCWLNPDNPKDCRLRLRIVAAPRHSVQVDWSIYQRQLLPVGIRRDHYEVEIVSGTPLSSITRVSWETDDVRDVRLRIQSEAESPLRWFKAEWRVYLKETRQRRVIDEIPGQAFSAG